MTQFAELEHLPDDNEPLTKRDARLFFPTIVEMVREEMQSAVKKSDLADHEKKDDERFKAVDRIEEKIGGVAGDKYNRGMMGKIDDIQMLLIEMAKPKSPSFRLTGSNVTIAMSILGSFAVSIMGWTTLKNTSDLHTKQIEQLQLSHDSIKVIRHYPMPK